MRDLQHSGGDVSRSLCALIVVVSVQEMGCFKKCVDRYEWPRNFPVSREIFQQDNEGVRSDIIDQHRAVSEQ